MDQATTYIGLDVGKKTIAVGIAEVGSRGEVRFYGSISRITKSGRLGLPKMPAQIASFAGPQSRFPAKPITSSGEKITLHQKVRVLHGRLLPL